MFLLGLLLFVLAIIVSVAVMRGYARRGWRAETETPRETGRSFQTFAPSAPRPSARAADPMQALRAAQPGDALVTDLDEYYLIRGVAILNELTIYDGTDVWSPTGRDFLLIQAEDETGQGRLFAWIPSAESDALRLYRMERQPSAGWTQFLAGTEDMPGPARAFAELEQQRDLPAEYLELIRFNRFDTRWEMSDIGQASYRGQGQIFLTERGEVRFAVAQETDGRRCLFYVDWLRGGAGSEDGLFIGQEFDLRFVKDVVPATTA